MLSCQRELFHLPDGLHYLNCAYMGPLLRSVEEAGIAAVRRRRDPGALVPRDWFTGTARARELFAQLVGCDAARVAISPGVSYAAATVARNLELRAEQNVVVARGQFPSNVYAWRRMCDGAGARLRTIDPPDAPDGRGEGWNARLLEAINGDTALVALGNVHWADGTRFDLVRIARRAREVGALLFVDGTQSVGAMPFDAGAIRPDVLVCAGYKWLLGPYSLGLAYFGERCDRWVPLEETWLGRMGSEDFTRLVDYADEYQPGAARFDVSERSNFVLMPMLIAALEQIVAWGPANVQDYCRELTHGLITEARGLGWRVEDEPWRGAHLFGLRAPAGADAARLQAALAERRVSVSLRGDAVRVAPNVYNTAEDCAALAEALRAAAG
ncbi:aminotransferase class V-fold PLP-dependent enzyme [Longimicrobium sp.]|uniref:aminotransferase class V-fold PLP-dependent enzyme n=1 Tax=Longimicrobium sp. TaxID=2029185 RepID=UPI002C75A031|nr:aminotransferase class V-fold PLP-dependent enzyme [Longimicrobium sp.]HSU12566.1 aminotransferase class V-fold PLP-dependent enzyme [Longimicrobium sp.]